MAKKGKTTETERQAWELYGKLGIERDSLPAYTDPVEFARALAREFTRPTRWIISQSGSSIEGTTA